MVGIGVWGLIMNASLSVGRAAGRVFVAVQAICRLFIGLTLLVAVVSGDAVAQSADDAADDWVKRQIGRTPRVIDSILGAPNDLLVGRQVSAEMGRIVNRIDARLSSEVGTLIKPKRRHGLCGSAALLKASTIASGAKNSRLFRGAGSAGLDIGSAAVSAPKAFLKYLRGEAYKKAEAWAYTQIRQQDPEDYSTSQTIGKCTVQMRVVWIKASDEYRFFIAGDCQCDRVRCFLGSKRRIALSKWYVYGSGSIVPKLRQARDGKKTVTFNISGVKKIDVVANCCGEGSYTSGPGDSWTGVPPKPGNRTALPGTATSTATPGGQPPSGSGKTPSPGSGTTPQPETGKQPPSGSAPGGTTPGGTPATGGEPAKDQSGTASPVRKYPLIAIPDIPPGPLCQEDLDKLIEAASSASFEAQTNFRAAHRAWVTLQVELEAKKAGVTKAMVDAAEEERNRQRKHYTKAGRALQDALKIKAKPCDDKKQQSSVPSSEGTSDGTELASADPDAEESEDDAQLLTMSLRFPRRCRLGRRCPMSLTLTNESDQPFRNKLLLSGGIEGAGWKRLDRASGDTQCAGAGAGILCAARASEIAAGGSVTFKVPGVLGSRARGPEATVCWQVIAGDAAKGGITAADQPHLFQFALREAGFEPGPVDGRIGRRTREAIARARAAADLPAGQETDGALYQWLLPDLPGSAAGLRACGTLALVRPTQRAQPVQRSESRRRRRNEDQQRVLRRLMRGLAIGLDHAARHGGQRRERRRREQPRETE